MSRESRLLGGSEALRGVRGRIAEVARTPWPVLLLGETGTGKTLAASEIHRLSARKGGPFVRADLGASVPTLVESELFGHVEGAFTGAEAAREGRFRAADGGTLFLDEVGNCPVEVQAKLLGALDHGEITPVGSDRPQKVDVQVIAATNANLLAMVRERRFRKDLLSRLNGFTIVLPPLRERLEDLDELVPHLLERALGELRERGGAAVPGSYTVTPDAWEAMRLHPWPENVRELLQALQRAIVSASDGVIRAEDLGIGSGRGSDVGGGGGGQPGVVGEAGVEEEGRRDGRAGPVGANPMASLVDEDGRLLTWDDVERGYLEAALEAAHGNVTAAARDIGVTRGRLRYRLQRLGIDPRRMLMRQGGQGPGAVP